MADYVGYKIESVPDDQSSYGERFFRQWSSYPIGVFVATTLDLSLGGAVMFGLLLASASFIAAPVVLRHAIPQAKPSLYITSALGITFPYNIIVLLPIMFLVSSFLHNEGSIDLFRYISNDWI